MEKCQSGTQASTYEEQCGEQRGWQSMIAGEVGYEVREEEGTRTRRAFWAIRGRVGAFDLL